jgi:hypothetical protein
VAASSIDLEAELDRLFALPLAEFVDARDELAARLKAAGDRAGAARVKALRKPSVPAWAVNQVRFSAPRVLEALVAAGDRLRSRPADMRAAMAQRREALGAARGKAEEILVAAGHPAPPQTMQRVAATLDALATYGNAPGRPAAGRLGEELSPPGFEELASLGLLPAASASPARAAPASLPAPAEHPKPARGAAASEVRAAREKAKRAQRMLAVKKREAEAARASLRAAEKKAESARRKKAELEAALAQVVREEGRLEAVAATAREAAEAAARALSEATAAAGSDRGGPAAARRRPGKR